MLARFSKIHAVAVVAVLVIFITLCDTHSAAAYVASGVEYGYVDYSREGGKDYFTETGQSVYPNIKAKGFYQKYSLMYSNSGRLDTGYSYYRYGLGYEWASVKTEVQSGTGVQDYSDGEGRFLYDGEIFLAPQGYPFRLKAYSREIKGVTLLNDFDPLLMTDHIIVPDVPTHIDNVSSVITSVSLKIGSFQGASTLNAAYSRDMPNITLNFLEQDTHSLNNAIVVDNKHRRYHTFLNRGGNWLQYKYVESIDWIRHDFDYQEKQFLIGNIDNMMNRHWIDLTNWIRVSADGEYFERSDLRSGSSTRMRVNAFSTMSREKWNLSFFNSFERSRDLAGLRKEIKIPVYANGIWNLTTDWYSRLSYADTKLTNPFGTTSTQKDALANLRITTFKRSPFQLTSSLGVQRVMNDFTSAYYVTGALETESTARFSDRYGLAGLYSVQGAFYSQGGQNDRLKQELKGRFTFRSNKILGEIKESLSLLSGEENNNVATRIASDEANTASPYYSFSMSEAMNTGYLRSITDLKIRWNHSARLYGDFNAQHDVIDLKIGGTLTETNFLTGMSYTHQHLTMDAQAIYRQSTGYTDKQFSYRQTSYREKNEWALRGRASYAPNNVLKANIVYSYINSVVDDYKETTHDLNQSLSYTFLPRRGLSRKLADVFESFGYTSSSYEKTTTFRLAGSYYPLRNLYLSGALKYYSVTPRDWDELTLSGAVGVSYTKLQASLDYSYGKRQGTDNRTEKRFSANVKKQF